MENIPDKSDSTAGVNGQLPASQYNDHKTELQKAVERSGQTLNPAITDQHSKAMFINGIGAATMVDSGSGNTITLQPLTGGSGLVPPDDYVEFNGGVVSFDKADANTGTAVTVSPWGLTAKPLVNKDLSLPAIGSIIGAIRIQWDNSEDKWLIVNTDAAKITLNTTHRTSDGSNHTFIDQDVKAAASPSFSGGVVPAANGEIGTLVAAASTAHATGTEYLPGSTVAGNTLIFSTAADNTYSSGLSGIGGGSASPTSVATSASTSFNYTGTWALRCRVYAGTTPGFKPVGLFQRIS